MAQRFQKGSGVYKCSECGKETRETGAGESQLCLCRHCMEKGEWLNFVQDGGDLSDVPEEFREEIRKEMEE